MRGRRIATLRGALGVAPEQHELRMLLADALYACGRETEAIEQYRYLFERGALPTEAMTRVGELAARLRRVGLASGCLQAVRESGGIDARPFPATSSPTGGNGRPVLHLVRAREATALDDKDWLGFDDVGGLEAAKRTIRRTLILPFERPQLHARYGCRPAGGVLLYGAPGCGKTLLARATAGECRLPLSQVRIEDVVSPRVGESERNLHVVFQDARRRAPRVVFLDALDTLADARRKPSGGVGRRLVDQLLRELDAIGVNKDEVLLIGATNAPWDVDDGLKRPGRFDRLVFVPPPDADARCRILAKIIADRPARRVDVRQLAEKAALFSGTDLARLVNDAYDRVIEQTLASATAPPADMSHFASALAEMRPSTLDWFARARRYVEVADREEPYRDVARLLESRDLRRWRV